MKTFSFILAEPQDCNSRCVGADAPIGAIRLWEEPAGDPITLLIRPVLVYKVDPYQVPPVGVVRRYQGAHSAELFCF